MTLTRLSRTAAPIALFTLATFSTPLVARAQSVSREAPVELEMKPVESLPAVISDDLTPPRAEPAQSLPESSASDHVARPELPPAEQEPPQSTRALPVGGDRSGVTNRAISVPTGGGTIEGMGESFSAQPSTGIATFAVPIVLPEGRGGIQASLQLGYSSAGGAGVAGMGWSLGTPFIARQTDRGIPAYDDRAAWHAEQDRFVFNGGQELVPICVVGPTLGCSAALTSVPLPTGMTNEVMPAWSAGWQYFRARVEGAFMRFFWSPGKQTWRVQEKSGNSMEFGVPLDGSGRSDALERNPDRPSEIYRWHLVRLYDAHGAVNTSSDPRPVNVAVFKYRQDGGMAYLSDVFDTTPASDPTSVDLSKYAHHVQLEYEQRSDPTTSYRSGWRIQQRLRLQRIDVTSKTFNGAVTAARRLLRSYQLGYESGHVSLLSSVQARGRCSGSEESAPAEDAQQKVGPTNCAGLPPMRFGYQHVEPVRADGSRGTAPAGYEGFDERVRAFGASPPHGLDEEQVALADVNSDGLPDVLVTRPGLYGPGHGVFFNGEAGADRFGSATPIGIAGALGANEGTITLKNPNVVPLDLDGDATIDLLHMPIARSYAVYRAVASNGIWQWQGRAIEVAGAQSPKIDFGKDAAETQVLDVDYDGLVDVVVSTGTQLQTFFALGRFPGGDGQFGHASFTSPSTAKLSIDPVTSCVPSSGGPLRFSDPDVKIADMNGDGIADIVRLRRGDLRYWPGRGNGFWGTGSRDDCAAGSFGENRHVSMADSPSYSDLQGDSLRLEDVNGDGLSDLVQIRFDAVDVWLNVDGASFTDRHIIEGTPHSPAFANRVRIADVNGSGTADILWGHAADYRYVDLSGGKRPWVMTSVDNGLGKTTRIEYSTSVAEMLAAASERTGEERGPWSKRMPLSVPVVKRFTERDGLERIGRSPGIYETEYSFRDPVYEGRQREFRGFSVARTRALGDANSPTSLTTTRFLLGECVDSGASTGDDCDAAHRYLDNNRDALKGMPLVTETHDESGVYLSTVHTAYTLRHLYTGLDGRAVRHAFQSSTNQFLYDTSPFVPSFEAFSSIPDVVVEGANEPGQARGFLVRTSWTGRVQLFTAVTVDPFGNQFRVTKNGCMSPCSPADEEISSFTHASRPAGDGSGWLWRTSETFTTGSAHSSLFKFIRTTFNAAGDPIDSTAEFSGTLPLDRSNAAGVAGAQSPLDATVDGEHRLTHVDYDAAGLGVAIRDAGPDGRCTDYGYDAAYQQLPTSETVYVGGAPPFAFGQCGPRTLVTAAAYDRGLGELTVITDPNLQVTLLAYDGLGRRTTLVKPSPDGSLPSLANPSVKISYMLADKNGKPFSVARTQVADGSPGGFLESWTFVDGLGRTLLTLGESELANRYVVTGLSALDAKGAVQKKYLDFFWSGSLSEDANSGTFSGEPPFVAAPAQYASQRYDAFGRGIQTKDLDGTTTLERRYHALSVDVWDAADIEPGPRQNTFATERRDGHDRIVQSTERIKVGATIEQRHVLTQYRPTGEPETVTRQRGSERVVHWFRYDTQGRMVMSVEPNATANFNPDPATAAPAVTSYSPTALKTLRYAYSDGGTLVGTSDARGCGINFFYDAAGRELGEDYSPCTLEQPVYSPANPATAVGLEVSYQYDDLALPAGSGLSAPPAGAANGDPGFGASFAKGRLVAMSDRGSTRFTQFDARGRATLTALKIARPDAPPNGFVNRYAPRWYYRSVAYDIADREVHVTTGARSPELLGTAVPQIAADPYNKSVVSTTYTARGTVGSVAGSYGTLIASFDRSADGLVNQMRYGDVASTTSDFGYDARRRLARIQTWRNAPALWTSPPANYLPPPVPNPSAFSFQLRLQDQEIAYDSVSNPTEIRDWRAAADWPAGAQPVTRQVQYDDLYRVTRVSYQYPSGSDAWGAPFWSENHGDTDARRGTPSPQTQFGSRTLWQSFEYDWLGNTSRTDDDAGGFYDRSLGAVTNGTPNAGPYQLTSASNGAVAGATSTGQLSTVYDPSGNLTRLSVRRNGTCIPEGAQCGQRFAYDWDEAGRLMRARRWDVAPASLPAANAPLPATAPAADLRYTYDGANVRRIKTASDALGVTRHTVYVFDTLELRRSPFLGGEYERGPWYEVPYLIAQGARIARVVYDEPGVPTVGGVVTHVFLELPDHLQSTNVIVDKATSELVEHSSFYAYGGAESDFRAWRWGGFREDYRFTGKEEDVEVGLQYFGERFYAPLLNRWVSPDPKRIHGVGADANVYAYVSGRAFKATDPLGLDEAGKPEQKADAGTTEQQGGSAKLPAPPAVPPPAPAPAPKTRQVQIRSPQPKCEWCQHFLDGGAAMAFSLKAQAIGAARYLYGRATGESPQEADRNAKILNGKLAPAHAAAMQSEGAAVGLAVGKVHAIRDARSTAPAAVPMLDLRPLPGELEGSALRIHEEAAISIGLQPGISLKSNTVAVTQLDHPGARIGPRLVSFHGEARMAAVVQRLAEGRGYRFVGWSSAGKGNPHAEPIAKVMAEILHPEVERGWIGASNKVCYQCQGDMIDVSFQGPTLIPMNPK